MTLKGSTFLKRDVITLQRQTIGGAVPRLLLVLPCSDTLFFHYLILLLTLYSNRFNFFFKQYAYYKINPLFLIHIYWLNFIIYKKDLNYSWFYELEFISFFFNYYGNELHARHCYIGITATRSMSEAGMVWMPERERERETYRHCSLSCISVV